MFTEHPRFRGLLPEQKEDKFQSLNKAEYHPSTKSEQRHIPEGRTRLGNWKSSF